MTDALNPLTLDIEHPDWYAFAECRGLTTGERDDIFFPPRGAASVTATVTAKAICAVCPVRPECLDHAITHIEPYGIWGGCTPRELRRIRRARAARPAA